MFTQRLKERESAHKTYLCVGLDPDYRSMEKAKFKGSLFDYNKLIIDATHSSALVFKCQIAFYSSIGKEDELEQTITYIQEKYPDIPVILDAKRGDIGSTSEHYAEEAFSRYHADAVTINPYLGVDAVLPFTKQTQKGLILLARTSNHSAAIQDRILDGRPLYDHFLSNSIPVQAHQNISFVVGADSGDALEYLSQHYPNNWLLIPGIGAQGGTVKKIAAHIRRPHAQLMLSVSRGLYQYSDNEQIISDYAANQALGYLNEIRKYFFS